jgi:adenine-specific DNA-methyltransferase
LSSKPNASMRVRKWGRFYTPSSLARVVVDWAIRTKHDVVLDVATGDGVFLLESIRRLSELGSSDRETEALLYGSEISKVAYRKAREGIFRSFKISAEGVYNADFFDLRPEGRREKEVRRPLTVPPVQAAIGNPPFVKYALMDDRSRRKALNRIRALGFNPKGPIDASSLFLIHAASFLRPDGRLAMIMPERVLFTEYGSLIRDYLRTRFHSVTLVMCDGWSFANVRERVVLVLADSDGTIGFSVRKLSFGDGNPTEITSLTSLGEWKPFDLNGSWNKLRFRTDQAGLLANLAEISGVHRLNEFATVGIGCVTGANHYFVLNKGAIRENSLPETFLRHAVSKASHLRGLYLRMEDWRRLFAQDEKCSILKVTRQHPAARSKFVQKYLASGRKAGIRDGYKVSDRAKWFEVPDHRPASALFTYMSHEYPRMVLNSARAINTNSIHSVRLGVKDKAAFCAAFYNSLTLVSCELLGRVYSGGVLKLEPSELGEVLVIDPQTVGLGSKMADLGPRIDERLTRRDLEGALDLVDPLVLSEGLGLSNAEVTKLRETYSNIRRTRIHG